MTYRPSYKNLTTNQRIILKFLTTKVGAVREPPLHALPIWHRIPKWGSYAERPDSLVDYEEIHAKYSGSHLHGNAESTVYR